MMNVLLINQLTIDFYSCTMIIASYSVSLHDIYFSGTSGYLVCLMFSGQQLLWIGLFSSTVSLVVITLERYVKIVHPVWHKNHFKRWMAYVGCAFSWASGFSISFSSHLLTTYVSNGRCVSAVQFSSRSSQLVYVWFNFMYLFQTPLLLFVICYVRIFQVIRRQNRIFQQTHGASTAAAASQSLSAAAAKDIVNDRKSWRRQMNAVKTMTFIVVFFTVSWLPSSVYYVVQTTTNSAMVWSSGYAALFIALFNVSANPFIYIVSYDDVRIYLSRKINGMLNVFRSQPVDNQSTTDTVGGYNIGLSTRG